MEQQQGTNEERMPLPSTEVVLEAIKIFSGLPKGEQDRIRTKAHKHAEASLGLFVHAVGSLNANRSAKKKVIESFFGKQLKPCQKGSDPKAEKTFEAAVLISTAVVMYQEGLLSKKPSQIALPPNVKP